MQPSYLKGKPFAVREDLGFEGTDCRYLYGFLGKFAGEVVTGPSPAVLSVAYMRQATR